MTYANPNVPIPPDPVFVDATIAAIQTELASLSWMTKAFGRSYIKVERRGAQKEFRTPMVYKGGSEYLPVEFNDNLQAMCFFEVGEQTPANTYEESVFNDYEVDAAIVFWCNLKKIDETKGNSYYFAEELKKDVRDIFRAKPFLNANIERIIEDIDEIWRPYSFKQINMQYFSYPYASFKFFLTLKVRESC